MGSTEGRDRLSAIVISIVAAAVSAISAIAAVSSYVETRRSNLDAEVSRSLALYLASYGEAIKSPLLMEAFANAQSFDELLPAEKRRAEIVNGQLVQVVDAMFAADDCRKNIWQMFLRDFSGPARAGYPIYVYAKSPKVVEILRNIQNFPPLTEAERDKVYRDSCGG